MSDKRQKISHNKQKRCINKCNQEEWITVVELNLFDGVPLGTYKCPSGKVILSSFGWLLL
jgi:hypothetical protein